MKQVRPGAGGFALIELTIVILIIATLVAIAVPVFVNGKSNAQMRACQANLRTVDGAIQSYEAMMLEGEAPTSIDDLIEPETMVLKSIPTCPSGDEPYIWVDDVTPCIHCPNNASHKI